MFTSKELVTQHKIDEISNASINILNDVQTAFEILNKAKEKLGVILAENNSYLWQRNISCYDLSGELEESKKYIKCQIWRYLVNKSSIKDFMSIKERKKLEGQLYYDKDHNLPDLTVENILETFNGFMNNADKIRSEAIKEIFEWLRPGTWNEYKTNKKYKIGKKVIKNYIFSLSWSGSLMINYAYEKELKALENVFTLLDGKGIKKYPKDIVTGIKEACQDNKCFYEDEYFNLKWYKKGTLHIDFKRDDLLSKLNKIGGDSSLVN